MPIQKLRSFDHEAKLEELAGVGKNRRFDEVIDEEENEDVQVICRRGEEEIPLARPSRAFYFGDATCTTGRPSVSTSSRRRASSAPISSAPTCRCLRNSSVPAGAAS